MESKLPFDTLGKIWDLADQDKDGMLNRHEFVVVIIKLYCLNCGVHVVTKSAKLRLVWCKYTFRLCI